MIQRIEAFISCIVGCVAGVAIGSIFLTSDPSYSAQGHGTFILIIAGLIGIFLSIILLEYKRSRLREIDTKLRNETMALITHEMRTGLTSTGWVIEVILGKYKEKLDGEDQKMLTDVLGSIHNSVMHSMNILDVSLLDMGKLVISLKWTPLLEVDQMFKETIERYELGARRINIKLISKVELDPKRLVEVDMTRLRIILENLLENSLQYTKEGEIEVSISNNAKTLILSVRDTGIGIPELEQEKMFTEFYRATNAKAHLPTGSGIGLYMCKEYVNVHHGTIVFTSEEGKGTKFTVTIPLKTEANVNEFLEKI
jgi:signal transduction histidine kinase